MKTTPNPYPPIEYDAPTPAQEAWRQGYRDALHDICGELLKAETPQSVDPLKLVQTLLDYMSKRGT